MSYAKLLRRIEDYIDSFYKDNSNPAILFHTYSRTLQVVNKVEKICKYYHLDERSRFIICAAAWFHSTGNLVGKFESFEVKSAELAEHFLRTNGASVTDIAEIKKCILATTRQSAPTTLNEKIICDAVTFYLGTRKFKENQKLLRKEIETIRNTQLDDDEWIEENVKLLKTHQYYTDYCKALLDDTKQDHLNKLKIKKMEKSAASDSEPVGENDPENKHVGAVTSETRRAMQARNKPVRGIETMFRISSSNSQKISGMADNKAHIMISVNSIIVSVVLGLIVEKLDENRYLLVPTIILLAVNVATIIYSVLATRPKVQKGIFTEEEVERKSVNLLFYGSFYNMSFKEYDFGMREMMNDTEFLYGSLIKDIYWQGKVLGRKYKFLHMSYNIFMYGIAISVLAFTVAIFVHR